MYSTHTGCSASYFVESSTLNSAGLASLGVDVKDVGAISDVYRHGIWLNFWTCSAIFFINTIAVIDSFVSLFSNPAVCEGNPHELIFVNAVLRDWSRESSLCSIG